MLDYHSSPQQDPGELVEGLTAVGRGIVYGGAAIGPGIGIGIVVGNAITRHGPPARGRRHGAHHHVPRHRLHRGARALRLRPLVHHLRLGGSAMRMRDCCSRRWSLACVASSASGRSAPTPRRARARRAELAERGGRRGHRHEAEECIARSLEEGGDPEDCQEAPSPILPADQRADLGSDLVRRALRPALGSSAARDQEGHGGPHRADPHRPRGRRARPRPRPRVCSTSTRPSWPTPSRGRPASSRRPASRPTR